jgi:hypothetical protein
MKDQADVKDMPTTMGSVMFRDHYPDRDCFVADKLKKAGAIFIGKSTLGELGAGDTHGSLFGSTRNVYDLKRTAGGSSGGSGAAVSANFCAVAIGLEGFAWISAVEGIKLSPESLEMFAEFDRKGLSNEEQDKAIFEMFKKKA